MNELHHEDAVSCRAKAMNHLHRHEFEAAEQCFVRLLGMAPQDIQALQFVADRHFVRQDYAKAVSLLRAADKAKPATAEILCQLGSVLLGAGEFNAAAQSLRHGLQLAPHMFVARLQLGIALEQLGDSTEALKAYFMAVRTAQLQGRWLNDGTTAPALRDFVRHAMDYAISGRQQLFSGVLDPLRERFGRSELGRVEQALAIYLGLQAANLPDPRQKPKFLYFPGIPSQPFYPRERFPWLDVLEAATPSIRAELHTVLAEQREMEAFLGVQNPEQAKEMLSSSNAQPAIWDAYFFYRHGHRYDEHCLRCPQTTAVLDALPLVRIRDHAPETLFSVLSPGTHILPHTGVTNTRLVTHLPLIVPSDCAIRVGGEDHVWQEGRCVTFDDTFVHEAWNRSGETRVVLILDSWNPDLSEAERLAVTDLVEAIGDFNQSCELPIVAE